MQFTSDNAGTVHPAVMEALAKANNGKAAAYGADALTARVLDQIRDVFEAPKASVHLVSTGTAANALALATLTKPWQAIFCARKAHVIEDECGAPEFFTNGASMVPVDGPGGKIDPGALDGMMAQQGHRGVHSVQRGPVTLTQATEDGTVYTLEEIAALTGIAHGHGQKVHLDGARFANALVHLGCSPADMTWKAGIDAVSFGGTKNGLMAAEAVIFFDPDAAWEFELRRKRSGHLFSKYRYLSAQMDAYLKDDLWLGLAGQANAAAGRLGAGLSRSRIARLSRPVEGNMVFADWPADHHRTLFDAGAAYYLWNGELDGPLATERPTARLVCDWASTDAQIDAFLAHFDG